MAISCVPFFVMVLLVLIFSVVAVDAQNLAPAPAPTKKSGTSVDQGIAYVLMLVALVLTYLIHPLDASYNFF
ncbi:hypothetical protein Scep_025801 [Stephania cephalantha]|uniref:Uncharacterized protein n=1 Tax=Stephania cephalantha TaxID=152367 RepID=A0AAP0HRI4_9MAGN